MMMINKNNWQEFRFDKIFTISRGTRLVKIDQINGDIAYISSSKKNNGIDNYILPPDYMAIYSNALTISNSGSVGYCFYHPYKFVSSDHCTIIEIKDTNIQLNNYIALFLKPMIEAMRSKYNFAREINNERLSKEIILLPANKAGSPDWQYMSNYIYHISLGINYDKRVVKDKPLALCKSRFKEFKVQDIFALERGKEQIQQLDDTGIPIISSTSFNNGMVGFKDNVKKIFSKNRIILANNGSIGTCFYQDVDFCATQDITVLYNKNLNIYNALFLTTILKLESHRFAYSRKWNDTRLKNTTLNLPTLASGKPDFDFMENYIKSLPYSSSL